MRDYAEVKGQGVITDEMAQAALNLLKVDARGFDQMDVKFLRAIMDRFDGGPVGVDSMAAGGEEINRERQAQGLPPVPFHRPLLFNGCTKPVYLKP